MNIDFSRTKIELGKKAAELGAKKINDAVNSNGSANIILATGASQFEMLSELVKIQIDWTKVNAFHLDEYIGISESHNASFRKYLKERFYNIVKTKSFEFINGENEPQIECNRISRIIERHPIDVAFIGIGENAHIAFNDPPADFETTEPYIIVNLNEACKLQQMGEGWFEKIEHVPEKAISMSVNQILKSNTIICCVPDSRKAEAVKMTFEKIISPQIPSSILKMHKDIYFYLDINSASKLIAEKKYEN